MVSGGDGAVVIVIRFGYNIVCCIYCAVVLVVDCRV